MLFYYVSDVAQRYVIYDFVNALFDVCLLLLFDQLSYLLKEDVSNSIFKQFEIHGKGHILRIGVVYSVFHQDLSGKCELYLAHLAHVLIEHAVV